MKKTILTLVVCLFTATIALAQTDKEAVKETIEKFSKAGGNNDVEALEECLDENYRIVMNRLFGSDEVSIMPKAVYVEKIKTKDFGGDTRKLTISDVVLNGNTASAKVEFKGAKMTFVSLMSLVKGKGQWKIISEIPIVK